jgi:NAD(P)-dependent dehydrogenase (short-subunit alcohol dehydrogenase family)
VRKRPLAEQVLLVSGASSGVGRAVARGAGDRAAAVVLTARTLEGLDAAAGEVEAAGGRAAVVAGDAADPEVVREAVATAVERFGRLDTVVASAMVTVFGEFERLTADELRRVVDVNLLSRVELLRAALPELRRSRGTFVDVNSALAYRGIPLQGAYCATKAAMRTLLETVRVELEHDGAGVDVCVVLPGAINTPQFDRARQKLGEQPQPVPPIYQPELVAAAVLRCCERPVRELPVTWGAQKLLWGQKLSPRAGDLLLRRNGWKSQTTGEPKPVDAPDNLDAALPGDPGARGRFADRSRGSSAWTSARLRLGKAGSAAALAAVPLVALGATAIGYHEVTKRG